VRRSKLAVIAVAAAVILGGGTLIVLGLDRDGGGSGPSLSSLTGAQQQSPEEKAKAARARRAQPLDAELQKITTASPEFSVAVLDRRTGQKYSFRGSERYETASVVKVQVLACLLLTAQDAGRDLTATELALAKRMIRLSDNDATTSLFSKLGRATAVGRCNKRLGLTQTRVDSAWGLTRTTVDDQVKLLAELVDTRGPLDAGSRKLAFTLMNTVDDSQDWGVPAAARTGEEFTVKNGWLARSTENYRWIVNSVGRVTGDRTDVSIAVLSHDNGTMSSGIAVVEKAAKLTRQYLRY